MPFNQAILKKGIKWLVTSIDWSRYLKGKPTIQSIAPAKWAKAITIPTLIVHGEHDFFIHPSRGKAIFSAIDNPDKQWVSVPTAGHNNVLKTPMQLYALMSDWLLKH